MSILERFQAYADAFEESYKDDDWSRIAQYFTEDAVYAGEPDADPDDPAATAKGREAVLTKLKNSVDGFDRRMDSRTLELHSPTLVGDILTTSFRVSLRKTGTPDLVFSGKEAATFEGDRIALLKDTLDPDSEQVLNKWLAENGAALA